jgi:hypothetical protein
MASRNLLLSDEALIRFQEKLDLSITKKTVIFREINELGEVILVLRFPCYISAERAWTQRDSIIQSAHKLGLAKKIVMTVKRKEYRSISLNWRNSVELRSINSRVIMDLIFGIQVSYEIIRFLKKVKTSA